MPEEDEKEFAEKLRASRRNRIRSVGDAKDAVKKNFSLYKYIETEDYIFVGMAFAVALLKDISDFPGIGSLPLIGTAVTLMATIFIGAAMYLAGAKGQRKSKMFFQRALAYISGTGAEFIFGLDFLPIETLMVGYLYYLLLKERAESKKE